MADNSKIEWTDATWNPIGGCSLASPGCTNCYAMVMADRIMQMSSVSARPSLYANTVQRVKGLPVWTGKVSLAQEAVLFRPFRWKRPRRIFVNSMGDLFHPAIPDGWIDRVFAVMDRAPRHTFQLLTKRPDRLLAYITSPGRYDAIQSAGEGLQHTSQASFPLLNVWTGISVEDHTRADERLPSLLQTPAALRFVSFEPLLGPVNPTWIEAGDGWIYNALTGETKLRGATRSPPPPAIRAIDWAIIGGESGRNARHFPISAARSLLRQCEDAGVPAFMKQLGKRPAYGPALLPNRDRKGADMALWPADLRVRDMPVSRHAFKPLLPPAATV